MTLYRYRICDRLILNPSSSHAPKPIRINYPSKFVRAHRRNPSSYLYPPSVEKRSDRRLSFPTEIPRFRSNPRRIEYPWLIARGRGLPTPTCLTSSKRYRANVFRYRAQRQIDSSRLTGIFLFASFPPSLSLSLSSRCNKFYNSSNLG